MVLTVTYLLIIFKYLSLSLMTPPSSKIIYTAVHCTVTLRCPVGFSICPKADSFSSFPNPNFLQLFCSCISHLSSWFCHQLAVSSQTLGIIFDFSPVFHPSHPTSQQHHFLNFQFSLFLLS